jgi:hypothetical protein
LYSERTEMGTSVCVSEDDGQTWHIGKYPVNPPVIEALGALEPEVVERFNTGGHSQLDVDADLAPGLRC